MRTYIGNGRLPDILMKERSCAGRSFEAVRLLWYGMEVTPWKRKKRKEDADMLAFTKKKMEPTLQERKEIAIATLQVVKNGTQESEMLQVALDWAIETLKKAEE